MIHFKDKVISTHRKSLSGITISEMPTTIIDAPGKNKYVEVLKMMFPEYVDYRIIEYGIFSRVKKFVKSSRKTDVMCWVACSERLPDSIGSYLCFWENCYVGMLFFNSNKEWCEMWQQEKHKPTHWMPLPKPPCT